MEFLEWVFDNFLHWGGLTIWLLIICGTLIVVAEKFSKWTNE